jgi:coatomer subunit beta
MIKKLLMLYWEIVPKYSADSKLLPEMILVCNALRNDLTSPNEFVRGCMLRFLCKMKEAELLEPLVPSIKLALEHRHSYVRRNAALAVYSIHKNFGDQLLPDGPELMEKFIRAESDMSARRNAFLMLFNEAEHIAIDFLTVHIDDIQKYGDGFALLVLELTRKVILEYLISATQSYNSTIRTSFIRPAAVILPRSRDLCGACSNC